MPRKKIGPQTQLAQARRGLAEKLADELRRSKECGQPLIYEQEFRTGKASVTVVWDLWEGVPLRERTATIFRSYEIAEGDEARERVALASGWTVPEAHAAGMLPYEIIPALRRTDPVTPEQARQAFLEEGASQLLDPQAPQLRFATQEEAQACRHRLVRRFPGTDDAWIIHREVMTQDHATAEGWANAEEQ
jgi:hypothetical protein